MSYYIMYCIYITFNYSYYLIYINRFDDVDNTLLILILLLFLYNIIMDKNQKAKAESRAANKGKTEAGFSGASTQGLVIEPHIAIVVSLLYVGIVIVLHMIGKYRKDSTIQA